MRLTFVDNHEIWVSIFIDLANSSEKKTNTSILNKEHKSISYTSLQNVENTNSESTLNNFTVNKMTWRTNCSNFREKLRMCSMVKKPRENFPGYSRFFEIIHPEIKENSAWRILMETSRQEGTWNYIEGLAQKEGIWEGTYFVADYG